MAGRVDLGPADRQAEGDRAGLEPDVAGAADPLDVVDRLNLGRLREQRGEPGLAEPGETVGRPGVAAEGGRDRRDQAAGRRRRRAGPRAGRDPPARRGRSSPDDGSAGPGRPPRSASEPSAGQVEAGGRVQRRPLRRRGPVPPAGRRPPLPSGTRGAAASLAGPGAGGGGSRGRPPSGRRSRCLPAVIRRRPCPAGSSARRGTPRSRRGTDATGIRTTEAMATLIATARMASVRVSMSDEGSRGPDEDDERTDEPIATIGPSERPLTMVLGATQPFGGAMPQRARCGRRRGWWRAGGGRPRGAVRVGSRAVRATRSGSVGTPAGRRRRASPHRPRASSWAGLGRRARWYAPQQGGTMPRMTIRTSPGRTTTPVAPRRSAPEPLLVEPGTIAPGRARAAAPLRRGGPGQADRRGEVRRRPGLPGRLVRRDDPLDRRPRPVRRLRPRARLRLVEGRRRHRRGHPRREHRQPDQRRPARPRADRRRDPAPCRAARPPRRRGSRDAPPRARAASRIRTTPSPPVFDPLESDHVFAHYDIASGDLDGRLRGGGPDPRGDLPGRPPGAALHREQRDDRGAPRGRRRRGPRLAPVPVLHPQGAEAGAPPDRRAGPGRPGGDGRRVRREGGVPVDHRPPRGAPQRGRPASRSG